MTSPLPRAFAALALLALALQVRAADDPSRYTPLPPLPLGSVLLSAPSNHFSPARSWEVRFAHRFNGSADDGSFTDRLRTLFGMDSGANVTMGASYTLRPDLELSLTRSNALDDYELAAKYLVMQEAAAIPVTLALRAGTDWRTEAELRDRTSFFAQAIVSRRIGRRAEVFAMPVVVTNAGRAVSGDTSGALFDHAFNVTLAGALVVMKDTTLVAELTPANRDLPDTMRGDEAWAVGIKRAIGGHHFEVVLTNSQAITVGQSASSTYLGTPLERGDLHIGFNIERRFGRGR